MAVPHITPIAAVRSGAHAGARVRTPDPVIDAGTFLLAAALSIVATLLTVVLTTLGEVSASSLVLSVAVIGFVSSWARSGRSQRRRPAIVTIVHR